MKCKTNNSNHEQSFVFDSMYVIQRFIFVDSQVNIIETLQCNDSQSKIRLTCVSRHPVS